MLTLDASAETIVALATKTHKVVTLEFVVPTVLAIPLAIMLSVGAVYSTSAPSSKQMANPGAMYEIRSLRLYLRCQCDWHHGSLSRFMR